MAVRSAMHHAGATALSELLQFPAPALDQRSLACPCGDQAVYQEVRSKTVLTAVGEVSVSRPYYLCPHCHHGQFPADVELDIEHTEFSPAVRRMQALVGQDAPFDQGRQQLKLLADLEVTTKAVERTAETLGEDVARGDQQEVRFSHTARSERREKADWNLSANGYEVRAPLGARRRTETVR